MSLTFVSLFSGVGGFDLGLEAAGWECVAQVEWDKQCQAVLQWHWPDVQRWGDVSTVSGADLPAADVIAFGSPCQDLSVAGKRAGLDGDRSGLFFEAIRIIREMRNATAGAQPRFVIWENVAGALSSSGGWDFAAVIDSLAELGAVDIAWRILDARFFGVPQRRRRVFVIADFGGQCAGAIHAEPEGVPWHPRTGRTERPLAATGTGTGTTTGGRPVATTDVIGTLSPGAHPGGFNGQDAYSGQLIPVVPTHTHTLTAGLGSGGPDFAHAAAGWLVGFSTRGRDSGTFDDQSWRHENDGHRRSDMGGATMSDDPKVFTKAKRASSPTDDESWVPGEVSPTLNSFDNAGESRATVLAFDSTFGNHSTVNDDLSPTIKVGTGLGIASPPAAMTQTAVRRLTPTECERLMGWSDDHTRWRADGTELADSTRYRMCGNGVASPVAEWIADMINMALEAEA